MVTPPAAPMAPYRDVTHYGHALAAFRAARGWSQEQFAAALGVDVGDVATLETIADQPPADLCCAIVRELLEPRDVAAFHLLVLGGPMALPGPVAAVLADLWAATAPPAVVH